MVMSKLKAGLVILFIVAASALIFSGWAQAVEIVYYAGGFHAQAEASVTHAGVTYHDGPNANGSPSAADISATADAGNVPFATEAIGWGQAQYNITGNALTMWLGSSAHGQPQSTDDTGSAYSNANAVAPGYTNGIFFQLLPTASYNEQYGDPVKVTFQWFYTYAVTGGGKAQLTAGYSEHEDDPLAITVGYDPYSGNPGSYVDKAVWTHARMVVDYDVGLTDGIFADDFFMAQLGDIIGVFLGVSAEMKFENTYNTTMTLCDSNLQMYADTPSDPPAVPLPGAVWLLGSGLLGLGGWRRFRRD